MGLDLKYVTVIIKDLILNFLLQYDYIITIIIMKCHKCKCNATIKLSYSNGSKE